MRLAGLLLLGTLAVGCGSGASTGEAPLLPLVQEVGPWPWVTSLVAYRDRLWFASSDRTRDCPCADLHSVDPRDGRVRYERHLFSQSVGRPAVHAGLLYWPLEDPRSSVGAVHVAVTDGQDWRLSTLADAAPLIHATAMASDGPTLWLATASPGIRLFASRDGGAVWAPRGEAPPRGDALRWVLRAVPLAGGLYGVAIEGHGASGRRVLARLDSGRAERVPGLPAGADVLDVVASGGRLLVVVEEAGASGLWASDGTRIEPLEPGPPEGRLRDLALDEAGRLWALSLAPAGGLIWRRDDTERWSLVARSEDGLPAELAIVAGRPWLGGQRGSSGALWGDPGAAPARAGSGPRAVLPEPPLARGTDWRESEALARAALARPDAYSDGARGAREALLALARSPAPPEAFERLLEGPFPDAEAPFLEPAITVPTRRLGPWLALWAIAVSGRGHVPVSMLQDPWPRHALGRNGKYFEPLLGALDAIAWNGQRDADTIAALMARLDAPGDPLWLRGDVVGALSAATGERHGYDREAWRRWWAAARADWRDPDGRSPLGPRTSGLEHRQSR
ncbi:MAG TPA: hypothetical protein VLC53_07795 [Myxococcota bacterium]|nr:hypothetical protein [Myxococcota bacterium]